MTYRQLLPDRFAFGRDEFAKDSYAMQEALPELLAELKAGTRSGASADLHFILGLLAFAHLGYPCCFDTRDVLNLGVDLSVHFLRGEWIKARPDLAPTIDKRPDNSELNWFDAYHQGLLVTLLSDRDAELRELADWPESWMETKPSVWRQHPLDARLYLLIANEFRAVPFPDVEDLRGTLRASRKKEHRLLYATWESVLARDQAAFDRCIVESVLQWQRSYDGYCAHPQNCIAEDASAILAAGRRLGLKMPELEPEIAARLLTRESIRLGTSHEVHPFFASRAAAPQDPMRQLLQSFGIIDRDD